MKAENIKVSIKDVPVVKEQLEKANKEIKRLQKENKKLKLCLGIVSPSRVLLEGKYWEKEDNEEIEKLNNIIDKAIEYIKDKECYCSQISDYLIKILEGEDKE